MKNQTTLILSADLTFGADISAALNTRGAQVPLICNKIEELKELQLSGVKCVVVPIGFNKGWSLDLFHEVRSLFAEAELLLVSDVLSLNECATQSIGAQGFFALPCDREKLIARLCKGPCCDTSKVS